MSVPVIGGVEPLNHAIREVEENQYAEGANL
jgi:hypothetical protein